MEASGPSQVSATGGRFSAKERAIPDGHRGRGSLASNPRQGPWVSFEGTRAISDDYRGLSAERRFSTMSKGLFLAGMEELVRQIKVLLNVLDGFEWLLNVLNGFDLLNGFECFEWF